MQKIKKWLAYCIAYGIVKYQRKYLKNPLKYQQKIFQNLIYQASKTSFGKDHNFHQIHNYQDFKNHVPLYDYEALSPYIKKIQEGKKNVLWKGKPLYFAKTSGTTSGNKYIPITKASIQNHISCARNALLYYIYASGNTNFLKGKMLFLSGSPYLQQQGGIYVGRLSGIVQHHVPGYLRKNYAPSYMTNCIEDWEEKLEKISQELANDKMTLIAGIPPWIQMFFDKIHSKNNTKMFDHLALLLHGGTNFKPYEKNLLLSLKKKVPTIETYPASEGFIAFQDQPHQEGLLLQINSGIFYEFITPENLMKKNNCRITIKEVKLGINYAIILNSNAGLWGYILGDTVKFVSKNPYRIVVTGRTKHFLSAFGEHVIVEEVEKAITYALKKHPEVVVIDFTVAPYISKFQQKESYHEWLIAFEQKPNNINDFAQTLSLCLQKLNSYYHDLIINKILAPAQIVCLQKDAFVLYMKKKGKLGGQNKVPRLANDRSIADELLLYRL